MTGQGTAQNGTYTGTQTVTGRAGNTRTQDITVTRQQHKAHCGRAAGRALIAAVDQDTATMLRAFIIAGLLASAPALAQERTALPPPVPRAATAAQPSGPERAAVRTGAAIDRTARRTGNAVGRAANRTGAALNRAGRWTGERVDRAARRTGAGVDRATTR